MKIWIVCGRYGTELEAPEVFYSEDAAYETISKYIADDVWNDFMDELDEAGISSDDTKGIIEWGMDNDYCTENVYTYSYDWHEFRVDQIEVEVGK